MKGIFRLLLLLFIVLVLIGGWIWWNRPTPVDMAASVPADALLYLESNSLIEVANAMQSSRVGRPLESYFGRQEQGRWRGLLTQLIRITGIGSAERVALARAQVAVMALDVTTNGDSSTLSVKPRGALIVETHTANFRILPILERRISEFAQRTLTRPQMKRSTIDGSELTEWHSDDGQRRIVSVTDGSVAIIGNSQEAVLSCLAARRGQRPNLAAQRELQEMRSKVGSDGALAFGYASSVNAEKIFTFAALFLIGPLALEPQGQQIIGRVAPNTLGAIGWTARSVSAGIEDRYLISLKPRFLSALHSETFGVTKPDEPWQLLPKTVHSWTVYNFAEPAAAWSSLNTAVSSQLDTVSTFLLTNLTRQSLLNYGIGDADNFLKAVKAPIITALLEADSDRPIVIGAVGDESMFRQFLQRQFSLRSLPNDNNSQPVFSSDGESAACLLGGYFLMGSSKDVRTSLEALANSSSFKTATVEVATLLQYPPVNEGAGVVTYTNDADRIRNLVDAFATIRGLRPSDSRPLIQGSFARTESKVTADGIDRRTVSAFGQIGALIGLAAAR